MLSRLAKCLTHQAAYCKLRYMRLGRQLQKYRKDHSRSIRAMAKVCGLSNPFLCQVENGSDETWLGMSSLSLLRITRAYKLDLAEIIIHLTKLAERKGLLPKCKTTN